MYKHILTIIITLIPLFSYCQTQSQNIENQNIENQNTISSAKDCDEFAYLSEIYQKKSLESTLYNEKYALISNNFNLMNQQCKNSIKNNNAYIGFRANALQQRRQKIE